MASSRSIVLLWLALSLLALAAWPPAARGSRLRVDRATGQAWWENPSDAPLATFGYSVRSESRSLNPHAWLSLTDHGDADSGGAVDPDNEWITFQGNAGYLAEGTFSGDVVLPAGGAVDLGVGLWRRTGSQDLTFDYFDNQTFELVSGTVVYVNDPPPLPADFNADGAVDAADYTAWRDGLGAAYTAEDYHAWRSAYGATLTPAAAPTPEPPAAAMALAAACSAAGLSRGDRSARPAGFR